jgi:hypothetical protein
MVSDGMRPLPGTRRRGLRVFRMQTARRRRHERARLRVFQAGESGEQSHGNEQQEAGVPPPHPGQDRSHGQ